MRYLLVALAAAAAACGATHKDTAPRSKLGLIVGLARDKNSGEGIEHAEISVAGRKNESGAHGLYQVDGIAPGTYMLTATYAGLTLKVANIDVSAGQATIVDLPFKLGEPGVFELDYSAQGEGDIEYFTTKVPRIEGTLSDARTHARISGAVVTAVAAEHSDDALQAVTDDSGRFKFDLAPIGTYNVSAYYSVGGRGQIEVRRGGITISEGVGAFVPLQIEVSK